MAAMASRADCEGPRGFSLESIMTAPGDGGRWREAAANMGSLMNGKVAAAEAAADRCRKERREKRGMRSLRLGSLRQGGVNVKSKSRAGERDRPRLSSGFRRPTLRFYRRNIPSGPEFYSLVCF